MENRGGFFPHSPAKWETRKKCEIEWREIRLRLHCQMNEQIPQKSEAWYKQRVHYVGTSEIAHFLELAYFTCYADLLTRKVGLKPPIGGGIPTPCLWGQTFETVTRAFLEKDMKVEMHGQKLFITSAKYPGICHSADGYFLNGGRAVLLQIKSSWKRIPGDEVPTQYLPQLWPGMDLAPFSDYGLFVDCFYRVCNAKQYAFNDMNIQDDEKTGRPLKIGLIAFYSEKKLEEMPAKFSEYDLSGDLRKEWEAHFSKFSDVHHLIF